MSFNVGFNTLPILSLSKLERTSTSRLYTKPLGQDTFIKSSNQSPLLFGMYKKKTEHASKRKELVCIHPKATYEDKQEAIQHLFSVKQVAEKPKNLSKNIQEVTGLSASAASILGSGVLVAHGIAPQVSHHTVEAGISTATGLTGVAFKQKIGDFVSDEFYPDEHYPKLTTTRRGIINDITQNRRRPSLENLHYFDEHGKRHFATITSEEAKDLRAAKYFQGQNEQQLKEALEYEHQPEHIANYHRDYEKYTRDVRDNPFNHSCNNPDASSYGQYFGPRSPAEKVKIARSNKEKGDSYYQSAFDKALRSFRTD